VPPCGRGGSLLVNTRTRGARACLVFATRSAETFRWSCRLRVPFCSDTISASPDSASRIRKAGSGAEPGGTYFARGFHDLPLPRGVDGRTAGMPGKRRPPISARASGPWKARRCGTRSPRRKVGWIEPLPRCSDWWLHRRGDDFESPRNVVWISGWLERRRLPAAACASRPKRRSPVNCRDDQLADTDSILFGLRTDRGL
jgi:hypothetical protein